MESYEDALTQAKRANLPNHIGTLILRAAAAGRLQRVTEAKAAFDGLRRNRPAYLDPEKPRSFLAAWIWDGDLVDGLIDGFVKAKALDTAPGGVASSVSHRAPVSDSGKTPARDAQRLDRGAPLYRHERGERSGLVLRWRGRRDSERVVAAERSARRRARIGVLVPRQRRRPEGDRREAAGRHGARRQRAPVGRSAAHYGAPLRRHERLSVVVGALRPQSERHLRRPGGDRESRRRASRNGFDDSAAQPHVVRHTENQEAYHLYLARTASLVFTIQGLAAAGERALRGSRAQGSELRAAVGGAGGPLRDSVAVWIRTGGIRQSPGAGRREPRARPQRPGGGCPPRSRIFVVVLRDYAPRSAAEAFERSIALDPTSGLSHIWFGWPTWPGREDAALAAARRAQELDPLNPYIHSLAGAVYDFWGRAEEGLREFDKAFEIDPNYLVGLYLGGGVYSRLGRHDEALRLFAQGVELSGRAPFYVSYYAWALARAGRVEEARAALAELEARAQTEYVQHLHLAVVCSALGDMDRAFELLELGVRDHNGWIGCPRMPMFENFRRILATPSTSAASATLTPSGRRPSGKSWACVSLLGLFIAVSTQVAGRPRSPAARLRIADR